MNACVFAVIIQGVCECVRIAREHVSVYPDAQLRVRICGHGCDCVVTSLSDCVLSIGFH